jgi:hypothetical protein
MPRPTAAQLAYGSCTVIFSTLAMLLLSQTSSGLGISVIALSALALGLLVAVTVPLPKPAPSPTFPASREHGGVPVAAAPPVPERIPAQRETASVSASASLAAEPVREPAGP